MPSTIEREALQDWMESAAVQVVEVLPEDEYRAAHLPGALHLPLKGLDASRAHRMLDTERPVVAYCNDFL